MTTAADAAAFFAATLAHETDPADLAAARRAGRAPVLIDVRSAEAWSQGRIPGARHVPGAELERRAAEAVPDLDSEVVVHCWGPAATAARAPR